MIVETTQELKIHLTLNEQEARQLLLCLRSDTKASDIIEDSETYELEEFRGQLRKTLLRATAARNNDEVTESEY